MIISPITILLVVMAAVVTTHGQKVTFDPFAVANSSLIDHIKEVMVRNPKMTAVELADSSNKILETKGISFAFSFDAATCLKIRSVKDLQKDPNAPIRLGATLKSVDANGAALALPSPKFTSAECGDCYVEMPVLEITDKDFVTVVAGRNIKFILPANFYANEIILLDSKDIKIIKRKWKIPFRAKPIGVSYDENVIYLGFEDLALKNLSLAIFGEGVFQIATREEAESSGTGKAESTKSTGTGQIIRFENWEKVFLLSYKPACPN